MLLLLLGEGATPHEEWTVSQPARPLSSRLQEELDSDRQPELSRCCQNCPGGRPPEATTAQLAAMNTEVAIPFLSAPTSPLLSPHPLLRGSQESTCLQGKEPVIREVEFLPKVTQHRGIQRRPPRSLHPKQQRKTSVCQHSAPRSLSLFSSILQVAEAPPEVLDTGVLRVYCQLPDCLWLALAPCPELGG